MTEVKCPVKDCLNNDKNGRCKLEEIELDRFGKCQNYERDMEWLREQLKKFLYVPVYDEYASGGTLVRVKDESV